MFTEAGSKLAKCSELKYKLCVFFRTTWQCDEKKTGNLYKIIVIIVLLNGENSDIRIVSNF